MTKDPNLTPYIEGLPLDFVALKDARDYCARLPSAHAIHGHLADLLMTLGGHIQDAPRKTAGQRAACEAFAFARSGLYALMEDSGTGPGAWQAQSFAGAWARHKFSQAAASFSPEEVEALQGAIAAPHLLPAWARDMCAAGKEAQAATLAATWAVFVMTIKHAAPDGDKDMLTVAVLEAFAPGHPAYFEPPKLRAYTATSEVIKEDPEDDYPAPDYTVPASLSQPVREEDPPTYQAPDIRA